MSYLIQNEVMVDLEIAEGFKLIDLDDVKKNMYYISEDGKIYSTFLNDFLKPRHDKNGYLAHSENCIKRILIYSFYHIIHTIM